MTAAPYASHLDRYIAAGWAGVLPLPAQAKKSPPNGYTGEDGAYPTVVQLGEWRAERGGGNIALRMPDGVIGIDVDNYGTKPGKATLDALTAEHGDLPPTWVSTSRDDGVSGIRFYRVPEGIKLIGALPGIEIIQRHHRYAVVAPSLHPEGREYRWISDAGEEVPDEVPAVDDLPDLPDAWFAALRADTRTSTERRRIATGHEVAPAVDRAYGEAMRGMTQGTRHDSTLAAVTTLVRLEDLGYPGASDTLDRLGSDFTAAVTADGSRKPAEADAEFNRMVESARQAVASTPAIAPRWEDRTQPTPGAIVLAGPGIKAAAMAAAEAPPSEPWPEPVGLTIAGPTPDVPIDALPRWLADQVRNVSTQLMCDPMLPFTFGLGALSVASLGHIRVAVRAGEVMRSTGLYLAAAGPPASGKSPALAFMMAPVRAFEAEAIHQASTELARSAARRKMAAKEAENASDLAARTGDPDDKRKAEELAAAAADEKDPPSGELMTSDITPERLASLMAANAERAAIVSDESGVLEIDRYGDKGAAKKLDIYLQSFTGEGVTVHRVKAPTVRLTTPLLAIVAGVQPEALAAAMGDHEWRTRGMGSRFLAASTTELAANTDIDLDLWDYDVGDAYDAEMGRLARQWASWATPATLSLSHDARRTFSTWAAALRGREMTGDLEGEGGWASKMRTSVLRIAALLHLADGQPHDADVAAETMTRAIRIGEFFIAHHTAEADESNTGSMKLLTCLLRLAGEDEGKTAQDGARRGLFAARSKLSKHGPRGMRRIEAYTPALVALIEAGLVRLVGVTGGPNMLVTEAIKRAPLIEIHPDAAQHVDRAALRGAARYWPVDGDETSRDVQDTAHTAHTAYRGFQTPPFLGVCAPDETDPRGVRGLAPESESRGVSVSAVDDVEKAIGDDEDGLF